MLKKVSLEKEKSILHTFKTRLGNIDVTAENVYYFPKGLYGFSDNYHFILSPLPNVDEKTPFFVMQSVDDAKLCFIVLNSNMDFNGKVWKSPSLLLKKDINLVAKSSNTPIENLRFGFLVSIQHDADKEITANTTAPLFFNIEEKIGWQEVLQNPCYSVKHPMGRL